MRSSLVNLFSISPLQSLQALLFSISQAHRPIGESFIAYDKVSGGISKSQSFPSLSVNPVDVTGAGDTFLAALVFYYIQLDSMDESIAFANKAAAIAVENPGTYTLTMEDVDEILR